MGSRQKPCNRGVAVLRAQAVSQKTRKTSASKTTKKSAAASRSASKGRAKASAKDTKKAAAKSSKKRSAMPSKNAKTVAKAAGSKSSASKAVAKTTKPAVKPVAAAAPKAAVKPAVPPRVEEKKPLTQRQGFKTNEFVVYPAHGVGQILAIEEQEIAGAKLELFVINFIKDKMTLRVPTAKVANVGMRKLSDPVLVRRRSRR